MPYLAFILSLLVHIVLAQQSTPQSNCTQVAYVIFEGPACYGGIIFRGQSTGPIVIETMTGGINFSTPGDGPFSYLGIFQY